MKSICLVFSFFIAILGLASTIVRADQRSGLTGGSVASDSVYNVKRFGAKGDGSTDDTASIQAAIDAIAVMKNAAVDRGGVLYFPTGVYVLSSKLMIEQKPISILGDGKAHSILKWTAQDGGIQFRGRGVGSNSMTVFEIRRVTLATAATQGGGTAIRLEWPIQRANPQKKTSISEIEIRGWDQFAKPSPDHYWNHAIWITNPGGLDISHTDLMGQSRKSDHGIRCDSPPESGPIRHFLSNLYVLGFKTGIGWSGPCEGVYMNNFEIVNCDTGFSAGSGDGGGGPVYHLANGHMDCFVAGAQFRNNNEVKLHSIAFYHKPKRKGEPRMPGNLVSLEGCQRFIVSGCSFYGHTPNPPDLPAQNGILVKNSSGIIMGNLFDTLRDRPVRFVNGRSACTTVGNRPKIE